MQTPQGQGQLPDDQHHFKFEIFNSSKQPIYKVFQQVDSSNLDSIKAWAAHLMTVSNNSVPQTATTAEPTQVTNNENIQSIKTILIKLMDLEYIKKLLKFWGGLFSVTLAVGLLIMIVTGIITVHNIEYGDFKMAISGPKKSVPLPKTPLIKGSP